VAQRMRRPLPNPCELSHMRAGGAACDALTTSVVEAMLSPPGAVRTHTVPVVVDGVTKQIPYTVRRAKASARLGLEVSVGCKVSEPIFPRPVRWRRSAVLETKP
jgi:hypothetical protein